MGLLMDICAVNMWLNVTTFKFKCSWLPLRRTFKIRREDTKNALNKKFKIKKFTEHSHFTIMSITRALIIMHEYKYAH